MLYLHVESVPLQKFMVKSMPSEPNLLGRNYLSKKLKVTLNLGITKTKDKQI